MNHTNYLLRNQIRIQPREVSENPALEGRVIAFINRESLQMLRGHGGMLRGAQGRGSLPSSGTMTS